MARKQSFKKAYVGIVMDMALARSKISNRMVAQRLEIDEGTIRNWRKEYKDFDRAFTEAREALREKINHVAGKSLDVRKRKVVTTSPDGVKTTIEDVLPTHNDISVFSKALGLGASVYSEGERLRDVLREVMKQKVSGKYTALEAAQLLEAEGIEVPKSLLLELQKSLGVPSSDLPSGAADAVATATTPDQAAEAYRNILG